jgi:hypothetical protein
MLNRATFDECFQNGQIHWRCVESKAAPTHRHSHASTRLADCLYVFGGLSSTNTSYNDLWLFDLNAKAWSRPATTGSYPSPKAAATLVVYNNTLVLFGGYSHPYSYPFNQQVNFFDELHIYSTKNSTWTPILFSQEAPKLAGHTASIINKNQLIIFGGCNGSLGNKTNAVHCINLDTFEWLNLLDRGLSNGSGQSTPGFIGVNGSTTNRSCREIDGFKPECRYGHSQVTIDDERVLIIGGCGGPNKLFDDIWILNWPKDYSRHAHWQQVIVNNLINAPAQLNCISLVRYGHKLITFGKPRLPVSLSAANNGATAVAKLPTFNGVIGENYLNGKHSTNNVYTIAGSLKMPTQRKCSCLMVMSSERSQSEKSQQINGNLATSNNVANAANTDCNNGDSIRTSPARSSSSSSEENQMRSHQQQQGDDDLLSDIDVNGNLNKTQRNTIKRLEALKKIATKFNKLKDEKEHKIIQQLNSTASLTKTQNTCLVHSKFMQVFVLDIAELIKSSPIVLNELCYLKEPPTVSWQTPIAHFCQAPIDTILYSLCKGIDELILFGGMETESQMMHIKSNYENVKNRVTNKLYMMKPNNLIICNKNQESNKG